MRIGELAHRVGVNPRTVRFYEGVGLLPEPARRPSGYREYREDDVERLAFVKTAQRLGLSLAEIHEIIALKERGERPCAYVLSVLDRQVVDIDQRLADLTALRADLVALQAQADRLPAGGARYCRIVEHVEVLPAPRAVRKRRAVSGGSCQPAPEDRVAAR
ncbi:MAG: heavy metal-responsive transcriptional regulator [Candidatus Dormibacteria bacterium]